MRNSLSLTFAVALAATTLSCVPSLANWDVAALEAEYPLLDDWSGHRLGDAAPYFSPLRDGIVLFLCRWRSDREIPVSLPPDATDEERAAVRAALAAWQGAGIGLRFVEVPEAQARLVIRFIGGEVVERRLGGSATTSADCALPKGLEAPAQGEAMAVELVRAEVDLRRSNVDLLGRPVPLSQDELAGTLLHELGHALGYPGHAAASKTVMVRSVDRVRQMGRPVMAHAGSGFSAPTVGALYALPNGAVVGRVTVSGERMAAVLRLARIARRAGWGAPFSRVGDRSARLWWVDGEGREAGFLIPGIERGWKSDLLWIPTRAAREHLARVRPR